MDVNLGADEIEQIIPHRYPMLLIDRMVEIEDGARGVGIKNVTANEWFFEGHFPGNRVMPGVLIVEALAQVAAVTLLRDVDQAGEIPMFGGIEKMRFRRPVTPATSCGWSSRWSGCGPGGPGGGGGERRWAGRGGRDHLLRAGGQPNRLGTGSGRPHGSLSEPFRPSASMESMPETVECARTRGSRQPSVAAAASRRSARLA